MIIVIGFVIIAYIAIGMVFGMLMDMRYRVLQNDRERFACICLWPRLLPAGWRARKRHVADPDHKGLNKSAKDISIRTYDG